MTDHDETPETPVYQHADPPTTPAPAYAGPSDPSPLPVTGMPVRFVAETGDVFAALVTAVWGPHCVNLLVFPDGRNSEHVYPREVQAGRGNGVAAFPVWETSINYAPSGAGLPFGQKSWHHVNEVLA